MLFYISYTEVQKYISESEGENGKGEKEAEIDV
jgi:hypothetical protein